MTIQEKIKAMDEGIMSLGLLHSNIINTWQELKAELEEQPKRKYGQLYVAFDIYGKNTFIETSFPELIEKYKKEKLWENIVLCDLVEAE